MNERNRPKVTLAKSLRHTRAQTINTHYGFKRKVTRTIYNLLNTEIIESKKPPDLSRNYRCNCKSANKRPDTVMGDSKNSVFANSSTAASGTKSTSYNQELIYYNLLRTNIKTTTTTNVKSINMIIYNSSAHLVAVFKEYLVLNDFTEFFQVFYKKDKAKVQLKKAIEFYSTKSKIHPNYLVLKERSLLLKRAKKKERAHNLRNNREESSKVPSILFESKFMASLLKDDLQKSHTLLSFNSPCNDKGIPELLEKLGMLSTKKANDGVMTERKVKDYNQVEKIVGILKGKTQKNYQKVLTSRTRSNKTITKTRNQQPKVQTLRTKSVKKKRVVKNAPCVRMSLNFDSKPRIIKHKHAPSLAVKSLESKRTLKSNSIEGLCFGTSKLTFKNL